MEKVTIQIPEEAIGYARVLVDELRETGAAVDTANWGQMAKVDENACARDERANLWIVGDRFRDGMLSVQREAVSQNLMHADLTITNGVYGVLAGCDVQQTIASLGRAEAANGRRKGWDSNPRWPQGPQRFSRPSHSTALAPLRKRGRIITHKSTLECSAG
jgi:hypothetical protein